MILKKILKALYARCRALNSNKFDEAGYLAANPDVAVAVKSGKLKTGFEHYKAWGKKEGRALLDLVRMTREDKAMYALDKNGQGLEIGPSHNPIAPKRKGYNVHVLDHLSAEDLRKKYVGHAALGVNIDNIEEVDFVWSGQPLPQLIGREACYDWIIASHVIEHVPDMVSFLQQCEKLLKDSGKISLVIPDKRYCFDYFNSLTSTGNVLDAWDEKRTKPSSGKVFDHFSNASKRAGNIAWREGSNGEFELVHGFDEAKDQLMAARANDAYIDVHCWRFTPASLRLILEDLLALDLITFEISSEFATEGCEFFVTLSKAKSSKRTARIDSLKSIGKENSQV